MYKTARAGVFDTDGNLLDSVIVQIEMTERLREADIDLTEANLRIWEVYPDSKE